MFVIQLPITKWNSDYFQGGCGGLCGSLHIPAECSTALGRGAAIGYSNLDQESVSMNNISWALNENIRIDFTYPANHTPSLAAKQIVNTFYGQMLKYSCFIGWSDGHREALFEALQFG
jgi:Tannase and feruloyl esterase